MTVTRRFCLCGYAAWSQGAWFVHADHQRPGCREISRREWETRHNPNRPQVAS